MPGINQPNIAIVLPEGVVKREIDHLSRRAREATARRRFQRPTPFREGNYWYLRVWDTNETGHRKYLRIKLAMATMPFREVQKVADEKLRPINQNLGLTGSAMSFGGFVTDVYRQTYLPLLSSSTQTCYSGTIKKYLFGSNTATFSQLRLRDLTRATLQQYFSNLANEVSHPVISKIRDALSSILRVAVDIEYLSNNPMEGLRLPVDKRPRRAKPAITPEQFERLVQAVAEPYATCCTLRCGPGSVSVN